MGVIRQRCRRQIRWLWRHSIASKGRQTSVSLDTLEQQTHVARIEVVLGARSHHQPWVALAVVAIQVHTACQAQPRPLVSSVERIIKQQSIVRRTYLPCSGCQARAARAACGAASLGGQRPGRRVIAPSGTPPPPGHQFRSATVDVPHSMCTKASAGATGRLASRDISEAASAHRDGHSDHGQQTNRARLEL